LDAGTSSGMGPLENAVVERARGGQPSRLKSFIAAAVVGFAAAAATFRLLRSGTSQTEDEGNGE
jgi:hypothetical protein